MGLSRQEVNLRRLLAKCELMLKSNKKDDDRLPKYIKSLSDILEEIRNVSTNENIDEYQRRIRNLKKQLGLDVEVEDSEGANEGNLSPRDELLGLKQRNVTKTAKTDDLDHLINYHQNAQAKIADDMLILTRNLKEQSQLANKIIKKDTEVVGRSSQLSEQNYSSLKVENEKLQEHSRRACKCWMWIMLAVVLLVFINMVLFMKVMKKK